MQYSTNYSTIRDDANRETLVW